MSLRLKMTVLFCGVLTLAMLIFGSIVYVLMDQGLNAITKRTVEEISEGVVHSTGILEEFPPAPERMTYLDLFADPERYIHIMDNNGTVLAQSSNMEAKLSALGHSYTQETHYESVDYVGEDNEEQSMSIYNRPLVVDGADVGLLQIFQATVVTSETLETLRLLLYLGGVFALLFAGILGWILASSTLAPIGQIAEAAQAIRQGQDLKKQIEYNGPQDEVGNLAETLNHMMGRLYKAYKDLEDAEMSQRFFLSDASHELRTPLTTIRGNAELLKKMGESYPEVRTEALNDIISEAERMTRLLTDMLALARADSGLRFDVNPVDLESVLSEICRQVTLLVQETNFKINDFSKIKGVYVLANADYLKQLFLILLQNAFQYAGAGADVWIDSVTGDKWVEVSVCDSGVGIDQRELPHIFKRFYRAGKTQGEGTGLGLSIAKWIAEQHNGSVNVQSAEGKGSIFTVRLQLTNPGENLAPM